MTKPISTGRECSECAAREALINKLKKEIERWKSRTATYKNQAARLRDIARVKP